ncbi:hypothetical protein [Actinotalea sp.]|uniref:hypothetical protein n=1 Tax=Actinotalea sp. TaxID=1872145 RepID=UPI003569A733
MNLDRTSREYAHWGFTDLPDAPGTPQVQLDGETWVDAEWWNVTDATGWASVATTLGITAADVIAGTAGIARLLIAGPDAVSNPVGTVVLAAGSHQDKVRLTDIPEAPARAGSGIRVH